LKRALKSNMKAVLENTPNEDVLVDNLNAQNLKVNRRVRTQAAMIGLAISMGATSLLVTRQSDQALAAEPVGNQNTASATPAAGGTGVKFATTNKLGIQAVSNVSVPENPSIVEPTAISQVPGLGAKWQIAANSATRASVPKTIATELTSVQATKGQRIASAIAKAQTAQPQAETVKVPDSYTVALPQTNSLSATTQTGSQSSDINAQLKAQQEFAINRLQQKSDRLKQSLAQLRVDQAPQVAAQEGNLQPFGDGTNSTIPGQKSVPVVPVETTVQPTASKVYEVKPGDTLAALALRNGTSVSEIIKANNLVNPNDLKISQKLNIPVAEANVSPTAAPTVTPSNQSFASNVAVPTTAQFAVAPTKTDSVSQANANSATISKSTESTSTGMGGDIPVPKIFAEMQVARNNPSNKQSKSSGLGSLKAEIERLREKYRAQQSGNQVVPTMNPSASTVSIPVYRQNVAIPTMPAMPARNNIAIPVPAYRPNNPAIQIPVPSYNAQPVNPDFAANQYGRNWNNSRNARNNAMPMPSVNINTAESFGNLPRGTAVSPQLPPLAAAPSDGYRYLPKAIDGNTPPLSIPSAPGNPSVSTAFIWPAKGVLTSGFGQRWGRPHRGIDVANATGTPIYASADGVIEKAGWNRGGYGNLVEVRHPDGTMTRYGHNSKVLVQVGQQVSQGQTIALMGSTGFSTGPHTHFEIHPSGKGAVNPIAFLPARI
jgi:murein DD-endopeptidase MepM/ murein hydrolase activator NlpD